MNVSSLKTSMDQQVRALNQIDELIKHCRKNALVGDVTEEDMQALEAHAGAMRKACDVVIKLAEQVMADKAKKKAAGKTGNTKEEKFTGEKTRERKKVAPAADDLYFLD